MSIAAFKEKSQMLAEHYGWPLTSAKGYVDGETFRRRRREPPAHALVGIDDYSEGFRAGYFHRPLSSGPTAQERGCLLSLSGFVATFLAGKPRSSGGHASRGIQADAFLVATGPVLALLLSFPGLLSLAPGRHPSPVFEPMECRLFVGKAPDVDPVPSRKHLDVLLGESELV